MENPAPPEAQDLNETVRVSIPTKVVEELVSDADTNAGSAGASPSKVAQALVAPIDRKIQDLEDRGASPGELQELRSRVDFAVKYLQNQAQSYGQVQTEKLRILEKTRRADKKRLKQLERQCEEDARALETKIRESYNNRMVAKNMELRTTKAKLQRHSQASEAMKSEVTVLRETVEELQAEADERGATMNKVQREFGDAMKKHEKREARLVELESREAAERTEREFEQRCEVQSDLLNEVSLAWGLERRSCGAAATMGLLLHRECFRERNFADGQTALLQTALEEIESLRTQLAAEEAQSEKITRTMDELLEENHSLTRELQEERESKSMLCEETVEIMSLKANLELWELNAEHDEEMHLELSETDKMRTRAYTNERYGKYQASRCAQLEKMLSQYLTHLDRQDKQLRTTEKLLKDTTSLGPVGCRLRTDLELLSEANSRILSEHEFVLENLNAIDVGNHAIVKGLLFCQKAAAECEDSQVGTPLTVGAWAATLNEGLSKQAVVSFSRYISGLKANLERENSKLRDRVLKDCQGLFDKRANERAKAIQDKQKTTIENLEKEIAQLTRTCRASAAKGQQATRNAEERLDKVYQKLREKDAALQHTTNSFKMLKAEMDELKAFSFAMREEEGFTGMAPPAESQSAIMGAWKKQIDDKKKQIRQLKSTINNLHAQMHDASMNVELAQRETQTLHRLAAGRRQEHANRELELSLEARQLKDTDRAHRQEIRLLKASVRRLAVAANSGHYANSEVNSTDAAQTKAVNDQWRRRIEISNAANVELEKEIHHERQMHKASTEKLCILSDLSEALREEIRILVEGHKLLEDEKQELTDSLVEIRGEIQRRIGLELRARHEKPREHSPALAEPMQRRGYPTSRMDTLEFNEN